MKPLPDFFNLAQYGILPEDVARMRFRCDPAALHPDVILLPAWQPVIFEGWVAPIVTITPDLVFESTYQGRPVSFVRCGVGAPQAGEFVLALGCTACERIVFTGSAGGLRKEMHIGNLLLPEFSLCGDGFSRYLEPGFPLPDCFLDHQMPDEGLAGALSGAVKRRAEQAGVAVHSGPVYSSDSVIGQFRILDELTGNLGCAGIEMETAAVFKAARMVGIRAGAVLMISDVSVSGLHLYTQRTDEDRSYRRAIRRQVLAPALLEGLCEV